MEKFRNQKKVAIISLSMRKTFSRKNIALLNVNQEDFMNEPKIKKRAGKLLTKDN
jgi:hypothetical protein